MRPYGDRLSLSLDAARRYGQRFDRDGLYVSADLRLPRDIMLFVGTNPGRNISGGILVPVDLEGPRGSTLILDYFNAAGAHGAPRAGAYGIALTSAKYRDAVAAAKGVLAIRFAESMNEIEEERILGGRRPSFHDMIAALDEAAADPAIAAVILRIDGMPLGFAQIQEVRAAVKRFRASGKKVYAALASTGNREYYLAAAADRVCLAPNSPFAITGLVAEVYFFKGLMDKAGVRFESISKGKYKSFNEPFIPRAYVGGAPRKPDGASLRSQHPVPRRYRRGPGARPRDDRVALRARIPGSRRCEKRALRRRGRLPVGT